MGRLAVLALLVTAVSGFVPGARPLRTAPRAASRSTRTVRMAMVRIVFTIKPNGVVQEEVATRERLRLELALLEHRHPVMECHLRAHVEI